MYLNINNFRNHMVPYKNIQVNKRPQMITMQHTRLPKLDIAKFHFTNVRDIHIY